MLSKTPSESGFEIYPSRQKRFTRRYTTGSTIVPRVPSAAKSQPKIRRTPSYISPVAGREERGPNVPDETPVRNLSRRKLLDMAMQKTQREEGLMGLLSQHSNTPLLHFLTLAPRGRDPGFPAPGDRLPRT